MKHVNEMLKHVEACLCCREKIIFQKKIEEYVGTVNIVVSLPKRSILSSKKQSFENVLQDKVNFSWFCHHFVIFLKTFTNFGTFFFSGE